MFNNTLTLKGKIREILSRAKTIFLDLLNIKKKFYLSKIWKNIDFVKKKRVIIIANGPSFSEDLCKNLIQKRQHFDLLAMNNYCLYNFAEKLIPDYYILSDPKHAEINSEEMKSINKTLFDYLSRDDIKFLAPYGKAWSVYKKPFLQFNDSQNLGSKNINPVLPRGYRSNTAFKAIALMLALDYEEIFILGFDYEYPRKIQINDKNKIILKNETAEISNFIDLSRDFDSVAHALHWWSLDNWHLKKLSSNRIKNVTNKSMIDVFARINPEAFILYLQDLS